MIEEPELGLHPIAVFALGHAVLHLMARGYRVAISSHSPLMLDFAWTLRRLKKLHLKDSHNLKHWRDALEINRHLAEQLTASTVRTYYLGYQSNNRVLCQDISELSMNSDNPAEAAWGLMEEDSSRMADIVSQMNLDFRNQ